MNSVFFYFIALSNRPSGKQLNRLTSDRVTERYSLMFFRESAHRISVRLT